MSSFHKKRKIHNLYRITDQNEIDLEHKNNKKENHHILSSIFKKPRVIYDSGWLDALPNSGNIIGPLPGQDPNAYGQVFTTVYPTTRRNQEAPLSLVFFFMQDLQIKEEWLHFVKSTLMIKPHPQVKTVGVIQYIPYEYEITNYTRVKGDNTLIYQGLYPFTEKHRQSEIDSGDILAPLTSKWFKGNIYFTDQGANWEYRSTNLMTVATYFEASLSPAPGGKKYNYKYFVTSAIDEISASTVTGTGTFEQHLWEEVSPNVWEEKITKTLNKTMTAPILEDITRLNVKNGTKYKNGKYQGSISQETSILTDGVLKNAENVPSRDRVGTIPRQSVTHTLVHETTIGGDEPEGLYRLWYDDKRVRVFVIDYNYELQNLPPAEVYQSGTLPYNLLRVEVNPDPHPLDKPDEEQYEAGDKTESWARIVPVNASRQEFRYFASGWIQLTAPATREIVMEDTFVNETYSDHGGEFYEKDGDNRPPKEILWYTPEDYVLSFRLKLTLVNPKYYQGVNGYKTNAL